MGRYFDPTIGRWLVPDPLAGKYPSISPYVYCANNPLKYIDPNGEELKAVKMMGLSSSDPVLKERTYYMDTKVADKAVSFVSEARKKFSKLSVNNSFRLESSSTIKTKNTTAKGLSRHQGGFAIDINGVSKLSDKELKELNKIAKKHGFAPLKNQKKDLPHFSANPTDHGYKSLKAAMDENKKDYEKKTKEEKKEDEKKE